ncbi:MAG: helix-turn-helix domain-containing protein [Gemmataceae bacterium]
MRVAKVSEYLKIAEAARVVGVSQNTLRNWAELGKVPVHRNPANGYSLFRKKDLEAFLTQLGQESSDSRKSRQ